MNVAFFDSGIGGLTVLDAAMQLLPNESYIYFADTENVPYGTKSNEEIKKLVFRAVDFLTHFDLKALVLACNTATAVVVNDLRTMYDFPIIGMEPAIKPATSLSDKKVLVCATERTLKEEKLDSLIENLNVENQIEKCSLQKLVTFAEQFDFKNPEVEIYLKQKFKNINWEDFDAIVLGCTHFLYFKPQLQKMLPSHISILDGNSGTIARLQKLITPNKSKSQTETRYFQSEKELSPLYFDNFLRFINEITDYRK
ncbi:MAG: glutamate racemase [Saprospiraceae bacterium]|nr:glutamate racemase [Bacteroidia bacterium]NNE13531.1 glutamate racemase [Saprospiraceae bacterium]NNL93622.1 glutamate racemase [Saprospiraceae bacterium]